MRSWKRSCRSVFNSDICACFVCKTGKRGGIKWESVPTFCRIQCFDDKVEDAGAPSLCRCCLLCRCYSAEAWSGSEGNGELPDYNQEVRDRKQQILDYLENLHFDKEDIIQGRI